MISIRTRRGKSAAFIAVGLGAIVVAGCNLLVSAGDYHVNAEGPEDATTGGDGAGPDTSTIDGSNDGAIADGNGSDSNDGAAPGDADTGTPLEDAGTCGATLQALYASNAQFQQLVLTCVLDNACDYDDFYGNGWAIDDCIAMDMPAATDSTSCELSAQNCTDIVNCRGEGFASSSQCDGGSSNSYCENNNAINCLPFDVSQDQGPGYFYSCDKAGGTCKIYEDDSGTYSNCAVTGCNQPAGTPECVGNDLVYCEGDAGFGQNCSLISATCELDAGDSNGPGCYYNQPACPAGGGTGAGACQGATGLWCYPLNGQQVVQRFNCGAGGLSCVPDSSNPNYAFDCADPACSADDVSNCQASETCTGDTATFCVRGALINFDCTKIGMHCNDDNLTVQCGPF